MNALQVKIHRVATSAREYDAVTVVIGDLHLRCDVTSDRVIRLAKKLADSHQAYFMYDAANAERVQSVLNDPSPSGVPTSLFDKYTRALEQIASLPHAPDAWVVASKALSE